MRVIYGAVAWLGMQGQKSVAFVLGGGDVKQWILARQIESHAGYAKPHVDHFCFVWTILRRASTKNYRRIGVEPFALEAPHFFGFVCPTQP